MKMTMSVCIDAPAPVVWAALARLEDLPLWSSGVRTATCPTGHESGVGAERVCELVGGINLTERWTAWDEGRSFTYEGVGIPLVKLARNTWTVTPAADPARTCTEEAGGVG